MNIYNFHKTRPNTPTCIINEFENKFFTKNRPQDLYLIKRKIKNENVIDNTEVSNTDTKNNNSYLSESSMSSFSKGEYENMKNSTVNIAKKIMILKEKINVLQTKYDFLSYCNVDLEKRNYKIKKDLCEQNEKEQNLVSLFFYIIRNFYPNVKLIDNCLIIEEDNKKKNCFRKQEFINQMFKNIQFYYPFQKCKTFDNSNNCCIPFDHFNINENEIKNKKSSQIEFENEIMYFSKILGFQKRYLNELNKNIPIETTGEFEFPFRTNFNNEFSFNESGLLQKSDLMLTKSPSYSFIEDFISFKRERDFELKENEYK